VTRFRRSRLSFLVRRFTGVRLVHSISNMLSVRDKVLSPQVHHGRLKGKEMR
jgi:hypothetical protein